MPVKKTPATPAKPAASKAAAPATKDTAKASSPATVTLKQLSVQIADTHELQRKQAEAFLSGAIDAIVTHLKDGSRIRINGLGVLEVKKRAARLGRNPATGEQIQIKASKKVSFRPAKELKEAI